MKNNILDQLAKDTAPNNADEFYLGMNAAALIDMLLYVDADEVDPTTFDAIVQGLKESLGYWRVKYSEEIIVAGDEARKSLDNR